MFRFRLVQALISRFQTPTHEDRALARFGQLQVVRQTSERPPVPLFLARKPRLV